MGDFFVYLFTFWIHSFKILRSFRIHTNSSCSSSKYLFKNTIIFIFTSIMVFWEKKFISWLTIKKVFIGELFMHLIAIYESLSLINNNIMLLKVLLCGIYRELVNLKDMVNKIKVKRDRRMTGFDLGFPSEFHVRHHACSWFNQW